MTDKKQWQSGLREASPYLTIGIQLAGTMIFYVGLGYVLDRWLETEPAFLITGGIVGMIAFFIQLLRISKELSSSQNQGPKPPDSDAESGV